MRMQPARTTHISDEDLDRLEAGSLPEPELAEIEEHLLVCHSCQDRAEEAGNFIRGVKAGGAELRREQPVRAWVRWLSASHSGWALAAVAAVVVIGVAVQVPRSVPAPQTVVLEATRGAASPFAKAPAGRPLSLALNAAELPPQAAYRAAIVDAAGSGVWAGTAPVAAGHAAISVARGLPRGRYYVRLYSPETELVREFGLQVE